MSVKHEIEEIVDEDKLYYRVHKSQIIEKNLIPGAFRERGNDETKSMSTDWEKYSTPKQTKNRARNPKDNAVIGFITIDLRGLNLSVIHSPSNKNRAHTGVKGIAEPIEKDTELRLKLLDVFNWEIEID